MNNYFIKNATIVNNNEQFFGSVYIYNDIIKEIVRGESESIPKGAIIIDAKGKFLIPGVIDDQVHFREPGLTHKGEIETESLAAVAGGITSFMEMPNTIPQATTIDLLEEKYILGSQKSAANYSFYLGATNDNIKEINKVDPKRICGVKVFMGSSTGNMLVDNLDSLAAIFAESPAIIATHCEDENIIRNNTAKYKAQFGEDISIAYHPTIRSEEACFKSSSLAAELAAKYNSRLHILHLSTAKELGLLSSGPVQNKRITGEVCVHHLWFDSSDYERYKTRIKWNPAIKLKEDKEALIQAVLDDKLDVIATDHAPHTIDEKNQTYFKAPSGGPLVQHSLTLMLEYVYQGIFPIELVVNKMCHSPAKLFKIKDRGFIKEGFKADIVLIDMNNPWTVSKENIAYKCKWSPMEGHTFKSKITHTFVNGALIYNNGQFVSSQKGERLEFN